MEITKDNENNVIVSITNEELAELKAKKENQIENGKLMTEEEHKEIHNDFKPLRPTRKTGVVKERIFDTTELDLTKQEGYIIHRDYSAHYFKYGFAGKHAIGGKKVLEIGCGSKAPLAYTMIFGEGFHADPPKIYVGVDYGKIKMAPTSKWCRVFENVDATSEETRNWLDKDFGKFDLVVNFEVIEHMSPESGLELLKTIKNSLTNEGYALLSTPVFNGKQAKNHIFEYTNEELRNAFDQAGLKVDNYWGTFMSYNDLKKALKEKYDEETFNTIFELYNKITEFYPHGVAASWLAPAFPEFARNIVWKVSKK